MLITLVIIPLILLHPRSPCFLPFLSPPPSKKTQLFLIFFYWIPVFFKKNILITMLEPLFDPLSTSFSPPLAFSLPISPSLPPLHLSPSPYSLSPSKKEKKTMHDDQLFFIFKKENRYPVEKN